MRTHQITSAALFLATLPALASTHTKKASVTRTSYSTIRHASAPTPAPARKTVVVAVRHEAPAPVQTMASERATAIQSALIKAGYLNGEPSGAWDAESSAAMAKFQADNDWQTKFTPDARALNKLGLGGPSSAEDAQ